MISKLNLKAKATSAIWSLRQKPSNFLFFLLLVLLPTQIGYHFWPSWSLVSGIRVDYYAPTIFLTDLIILALAAVWLPRQQLKLKEHKVLIAIAGIFILINTVFSLNIFVTLYKWLKLLELAFVAYYVFKSRAVIKKEIPKYLIIGLGYTLILAIAEIAAGQTIGGIFAWLGERTFNIMTPGIALVNVFGRILLRPYATFPHPNVLAGFSLVCLFIVLTFEHNRVLKTLGIVLSGALVMLSFSQGALIALVVCLAIYFFGFQRHLGQIYKQLVLGLVLISLVIMPVGQMVLQNSRGLPESLARRLELSTIAGEAVASSPAIGVGEGNFISFIPKSIFQSNLWFLQPVHNLFLLVLSETGVIGLAAFVVLLVSLKNFKDPKNYLIVLPILITGMFDHYFLTLQQTQILFAIVIGILLNHEKQLNN